MIKIFSESSPAHFPFLTTAVQPFTDHSQGRFMESDDTIVILTYTVILEMATQLGFQDLPPFFGFDLIAYGFKPCVHGLAFGGVFLTTRLAANFEVTFP